MADTATQSAALTPDNAQAARRHRRAAVQLCRQAFDELQHALHAADYDHLPILTQIAHLAGAIDQPLLRTAPQLRYAEAQLDRGRCELALAVLQNALTLECYHAGPWVTEPQRATAVADIYARIAQTLADRAPESCDWRNSIPRVALVCSGLADGQVLARFLTDLTPRLDPERLALRVYSTEAHAADWPTPLPGGRKLESSTTRAAATLRALRDAGIAIHLEQLGDDRADRAARLARQIVDDRIDVTLYAADPSDPVAAVMASWDLSAGKVDLALRRPLYAPGTHAAICTDLARFSVETDAWKARGAWCELIMPGVADADDSALAVDRHELGIAADALVILNLADHAEHLDDDLLHSSAQVLTRHPKAVFISSAAEMPSARRATFRAAGVNDRVAFTGPLKDPRRLIAACDIYLAEAPLRQAQAVLWAMSAAKPAIALNSSDSHASDWTHRLLGDLPNLCATPADRQALLDRCLTQRPWREAIGHACHRRAVEHFSFDRTARHFMELIEQVILQTSAQERPAEQMVLAE